MVVRSCVLFMRVKFAVPPYRILRSKRPQVFPDAFRDIIDGGRAVLTCVSESGILNDDDDDGR